MEAIGTLVAAATVHRSLDPGAFAKSLPLRIGTVALESSVRMIVLVPRDAIIGQRVSLRAASDGHAIEAVVLADPSARPRSQD